MYDKICNVLFKNSEKKLKEQAVVIKNLPLKAIEIVLLCKKL